MEFCTVATGNLYIAHFRFESPSSGFTTSLAYKQLSGTNDENTLTDLAGQLGVMHQSAFLDCLSDDASMTAILTFQVTGSNETPGRTRFEQPNVGTVSSDALPMGACAVLSILTDAPHSRFNGRLFISGVPKSFDTEGALSGAALTLYNTLAGSLEATVSPIGPGLAVFQPVVISRILNGAPRVPPVGFSIVSISADGFIKNQRRRNTRFLGPGGTT